MTKVIPNMIGQKKTNIKEVGNDGNGQVDDPDVETVDLPGYNATKGFLS